MTEPSSTADARHRSWLCPTEPDYARMLQGTAKLARPRRIISVCIAATMVLGIPWLGWWPAAISGMLLVAYQVLDRVLLKAPNAHDLSVTLPMWMTSVGLAGAASATGGPTSPLLPMIALPLILAANRFRRTVSLAALIFTISLTALITIVLKPHETMAAPTLTISTMLMFVGSAVLTLSLSDTEMRLRAASRYDPLTGLLNRSGLDELLERMRIQFRASESPVSLILFDLDHFKQVNDNYGHDRGDAALSALADELSSDLRRDDLAVRLGGEEFALVLPGVDATLARQIADRMRVRFAESRPAGLEITVSGGVAATPGHALSWERLYREADIALLSAKRRGRNRIIVAGDDDAGSAGAA